jgi:hypothetical protein
MVQAKGKAGGSFANPHPDLEGMIRDTLKANKISLTKIEKDPLGNPKLGILHNVKMLEPSRTDKPDLFSKPRSPEMAALTGLKPHGGHFYGKGLVVTQSLNEKGKVVKSAITFRVVSSKHQAEGRWMAPAIQPFNSIKAAFEWANSQWNQILKQIEQQVNQPKV